MGLWTSKSPSPSVVAVQSILRYEFKTKSLLEQALTHSSYTDSESYERLEFVGDGVIGLAVAKLLFVTYPDLDPGRLSILRAENVSREKLARIAVRRGLYKHMNHSAPDLKLQVEKFVSSIKEEGDEMKAPKVLSDLVESVTAAVYVDCGFNLELTWKMAMSNDGYIPDGSTASDIKTERQKYISRLIFSREEEFREHGMWRTQNDRQGSWKLIDMHMALIEDHGFHWLDQVQFLRHDRDLLLAFIEC